MLFGGLLVGSGVGWGFWFGWLTRSTPVIVVVMSSSPVRSSCARVVRDTDFGEVSVVLRVSGWVHGCCSCCCCRIVQSCCAIVASDMDIGRGKWGGEKEEIGKGELAHSREVNPTIRSNSA